MSFLGQRLILISSGEDSGWLKFIFGLCSVFFNPSMDHGGFGLAPVSLWINYYGLVRNWIKPSNWSLQTIFSLMVTNCSGLGPVKVDAVISRCNKQMTNKVKSSKSAKVDVITTPCCQHQHSAYCWILPLLEHPSLLKYQCELLALSCLLDLLMIASICKQLFINLHRQPTFLLRNWKLFLERWIF